MDRAFPSPTSLPLPDKSLVDIEPMIPHQHLVELFGEQGELNCQLIVIGAVVLEEAI